MNAREWWKKHYRLMRIARRESMKAFHDCMLFGTGFVSVDRNGEAKHMNPWDVQIQIPVRAGA